MRFMFYILVLSLFTSLTLISYEGLDVERLPFLRSKRYEIPYDKIVVYTAPRTGSSLVFNVFRFLFEKEDKILSMHTENDPDKVLLKVHDFIDEEAFPGKKVLYVMTIRDPVDTCISQYRVFAEEISNLQQFAERQMANQLDYIQSYEKMVEKGLNTQLYWYETFNANLDSLLEEIEAHFQLSIYQADKELLREGLSKENVQCCTAALNGFHEYLPYSGFHGKHVSLKSYTPPDEMYFWIGAYLLQVKHLFATYGYYE